MLGAALALAGVTSAAAESGALKSVEARTPARNAQAAPERGAPAGGGAVIETPADEPDGAGSARAPRGPGVEIITGGNSADGAAKVGHLPILD